ncbi:TPA: aspartate aminotransferase family protein [Candidatus Poribacteria bacterium]|nr:aspartate aminotransferase family protein [Candidatus Poribacteria bacterium]HIA67194.1 aspartate aminotransferase family protein [Candidatus Poribacteria bacterium]HIB90997.1 aspartate aminotransferase family protein [Candidatus Poribacteria bacterium]HIB98916.1 aspartate aminotransferase family protein [Candidatus Poribacteria bacterium]HIN31049.1 aspartate aminotransferase family protein [Candidatus Poribacteria bacterium]
MTTAEIKEMATKYIMNTYGDRQLALVRGEGPYVWDAEGNKYLDFLSGIAVNGLGHCHPKVVEAIRNQAGKLMHVSNLYYIEPQAKLAKLMIDNSDLDQCFFCNSGAEANEAAIKIARKYAVDKGRSSAYEIITMHDSFHGRTMATITATAQTKYHKGFEPMLPGFSYVPFDDLDTVAKAITSQTCAILVEPIQSEGGVNVPGEGYLEGLREMCDQHDLLLIFDEMQTSPGRLGAFFGYQTYGVIPDVLTMAKFLGGGTPIGAMLAKKEVAESFVPGTHAATFGGNPLVTAAALATLETIVEEDLFKNVISVGNYLEEKFTRLQELAPIKEIRGRGLLRGVVFEIDAKPIAAKCIENGLITICTNDYVLRFMPPLNITTDHVDEAYNIVSKSIANIT